MNYPRTASLSTRAGIGLLLAGVSPAIADEFGGGYGVAAFVVGLLAAFWFVWQIEARR